MVVASARTQLIWPFEERDPLCLKGRSGDSRDHALNDHTCSRIAHRAADNNRRHAENRAGCRLGDGDRQLSRGAHCIRPVTVLIDTIAANLCRPGVDGRSTVITILVVCYKARGGGTSLSRGSRIAKPIPIGIAKEGPEDSLIHLPVTVVIYAVADLSGGSSRGGIADRPAAISRADLNAAPRTGSYPRRARRPHIKAFIG